MPLPAPAWRPSRPLRLVLFDVFDTLLQPILPPHVQYAQEARRLGLDVADDDVQRAFKQAFRTLWNQHPNYGLSTSLASPDEWWRLVIHSTFSPDHHPLITASQHFSVLPLLSTRLLDRFASRRAYRLFPDVLPTLSSLPRSLPLALATNSDTRILSALSDFQMNRYFDLAIDHPQYYDRGGGGPTLSCIEQCAKPDPAFFKAAVRRNCQEEVRLDQVLYVGDQREEDFWAAIQVGLQAVWVDREGTRYQPTTQEQEARADEERTFLSQRTVRDLRQLVDVVSSSHNSST
ncbi:hypothetical protein ACQY0O_003638 [Thecaphora frezii]